MAVSESNSAFGSSTSTSIKTDLAPGLPQPLKQEKALSIRSVSEIDQFIELSATSTSEDASGHSETEAYEETAVPVVPPTDFQVDLNHLTAEELADLLQEYKNHGEKRKKQRAKELKELEQKLKLLEDKLERKIGMTTSMATYTQAIKTDMPLPTYVITSQTQLCRAFHLNQIYMNQIQRMQKRNKKLIGFLAKQVKMLELESELRRAPLKQRLVIAKNEVVQMCRVLEIEPDQWGRRTNSSDPLQRISNVLEKGIPMLTEWVARTSSSFNSK